MLEQGYHKGQLCIVDFLLCQEGYCANCQIFAEKMSARSEVEVQVDKSQESSMVPDKSPVHSQAVR